MSNFQSRVLTGAGLVITMLLAIYLGKFTFSVFFAALISLGLWEFYSLFDKTAIAPQKNSGVVIGLIIFILLFLVSIGWIKGQIVLILILAVLFVIIFELFRKKDTPFENIAVTLLGIIYIAFPVSLLWPIAYRENLYQFNPHLIFGYFILIWTYDSLAYLSGMTFGKHKLFERISPKKTWEGAIGGYVFTLVACYILSLFYVELSLIKWIFFGTIVAIFGTFGDLTESLLKRSLDVKDSGTILPGHGGILDRFDALFLAIPVLYLYLQYV